MKKEIPGISTKEQIFESAVHLIFEKGYHASSMRDLAKAVGIKESSIYYHFPSKNAILDSILQYYIEAFNASLPSEEEMKITAAQHNDAVDLWLAGIMEFMIKQPPLMKTVAGILLNEMFLNEKCRAFVLNIMFKIQKEATEFLLSDMQRLGLIKDCDLKQTADQYVYMLHGLDMEIRLLEKEGTDPDEIRNKLISTVTFFIEGLK